MCYPKLSKTDPKPSKTGPKSVQNLILSELFHSNLNEYPCDKIFIHFLCIIYIEGTSMYSIQVKQ
jgi:hypothetical protein